MRGKWQCPWCADAEVPAPGQLCGRCQQEPDAVEFKAAHDAQCPCVRDQSRDAPPVLSLATGERIGDMTPDEIRASKYRCQAEGCMRHPDSGDTIIRVSPKGQPFAGLCAEEHYQGLDDPVVTSVERALRT